MQKEFAALQKTLAANVRALRRQHSLSQEALAGEAEIDRTYISQLERSLINPSLLVLHKIGRALQTHPADLLRHHK